MRHAVRPRQSRGNMGLNAGPSGQEAKPSALDRRYAPAPLKLIFFPCILYSSVPLRTLESASSQPEQGSHYYRFLLTSTSWISMRSGTTSTNS